MTEAATDPILALHCMLASGGAWKGVAARIDRPLLTPDLPGHGAAPDAPGPYMDDAVRIAWDAAPEGAFDLLGHSFGACVGLRMMAERPDRIRRAVLVEPVMFAAADPSARDAYVASMGGYADAMERGDPDAALRAFHAVWGAGDLDALPGRAVAYMRDRIHLVAAGGPAIVEDAHGVLDRLPGEVPVTVVLGAPRLPIMAAIRDGLARRMPQAQARDVRGAGHMAPLTHAAAVAGIVRHAFGPTEGGRRAG